MVLQQKNNQPKIKNNFYCVLWESIKQKKDACLFLSIFRGMASVRIKIFCIFLTVFCTFLCVHTGNAEEFLYPVVATGSGADQKVYVLYQKSLTHIELWLWDPVTKIATKALLSTFTPAGISLLPDDIGFSFIDNGRVKVKMHSKRSPKSLEWYEPVYDIGNLHWINNTCYYFHAKEQERYGLFHGTMHGEIDPLVIHHEKDCMYPHKIESTLFYIERTPSVQGGSYAIMRAPYPLISCDSTSPFNNTKDFERRVAELLSTNFQKKEPLIVSENHEKIIDFGQQAVAFLYMLSDKEGFCIGHPTHIDKHDATMTLVCYQLRAPTTTLGVLTDTAPKGLSEMIFQNSASCMTSSGTPIQAASEKRTPANFLGWQVQELFTFEIPLDVLLPESDSRLYESMLPLLPRYDEHVIYFVDSARRTHINTDKNKLLTKTTPVLYCYSRANGTVTQLSHTHYVQQAFFSPLSLGDSLIYGGSILYEDGVRVTGAPGMWLNEQGQLSIELPKMKRATA